MTGDTLPAEFGQLGLDTANFRRSDNRSFRGPCPTCGGHRRFVIFVDHEWPLNYGYCSECGQELRAWLKFPRQIDPARLQQMRDEEKQALEERRQRRMSKLEELRQAEVWLTYHDRMTEEQKWWWESQGIPEGIQSYLSLGHIEEKRYYDHDMQLLSSPAYTIPFFGPDFKLVTMQYRLESPANPNDRYRFEEGLGGGGEHVYYPDPSPIKDKVIICEGAKKSIVCCYLLAPIPLNFTVIGCSSSNTVGTALKLTEQCGLRIVILDPDATNWSRRAVESNPKTTRELRLPAKLDDAYLEFGLDRSMFARMLNASWGDMAR